MSEANERASVQMGGLTWDFIGPTDYAFTLGDVRMELHLAAPGWYIDVHHMYDPVEWHKFGPGVLDEVAQEAHDWLTESLRREVKESAEIPAATDISNLYAPGGPLHEGQLDALVINIIGCSCCGRDHNTVQFRRLNPPLNLDSSLWTHRGLCPDEHEFIYLRYDEPDGLTAYVVPRVKLELAGLPISHEYSPDGDRAAALIDLLRLNLGEAFRRIAALEEKLSKAEGGK